MKKFFTLLLVAVGIAGVAQAQPGSRDHRDSRDIRWEDQRNNDRIYYDDRDGRYDNNGRFANERRLKMAISRIDREYDYKIQRVRNNYYLSRFEKQRQLRLLEQQREREIQMLIATARRNDHYNRRNYPDNRRY